MFKIGLKLFIASALLLASLVVSAATQTFQITATPGETKSSYPTLNIPQGTPVTITVIPNCSGASYAGELCFAYGYVFTGGGSGWVDAQHVIYAGSHDNSGSKTKTIISQGTIHLNLEASTNGYQSHPFANVTIVATW